MGIIECLLLKVPISKNWLNLQTALDQMRQLVMSSLITIYTVYLLDFEFLFLWMNQVFKFCRF